MNKHFLAAMVSTLLLSTAALAQDNRRDDEDKKPERPARPGQPSKPQPAPQPAAPQQAPAPKPQTQAPEPRRPMVIQLGHPARPEPRNDNRPQQQPQPRSQPQQQQQQSSQPKPNPRPQRPATPRPYQAPSYGQVRSPTNSDNPRPATPAPHPAQPVGASPQAADPNFHSGRAVSHHPYTQGYVRQRLQKIGVKSEPGFIVDRSEMMLSDRQHSVLPRPDRGPNNKELRSSPIPARNFNVDVVRTHMTLVGRVDFMQHLERAGASESERGHHYWHNERGFAYSHYIDNSGFQWYGWYVGEQHFWTRSYGGRWWWYDEGFGRWCFWNDNFWWWQDPNHLGDLYCYNNSEYIPVNSADDQIVVTSNDHPDSSTFQSPDGSRIVKIASDSKDAFLYDAAVPPAFEPEYLASGVVEVQFSNPNTGRPMQIILKLDDGSYDVLDANGDPYTTPSNRSINSN